MNDKITSRKWNQIILVEYEYIPGEKHATSVIIGV